MVRKTETILCDGCGVEITWVPEISGNHLYCCIDCQQGRPCKCGDRMDDEEEYRDNIAAIFESGGII
jgi:hypothetical protein